MARNIYGEQLSWSVGSDAVHSAMSFLNLTKCAIVRIHERNAAETD